MREDNGLIKGIVCVREGGKGLHEELDRKKALETVGHDIADRRSPHAAVCAVHGVKKASDPGSMQHQTDPVEGPVEPPKIGADLCRCDAGENDAGAPNDEAHWQKVPGLQPEEEPLDLAVPVPGDDLRGLTPHLLVHLWVEVALGVIKRVGERMVYVVLSTPPGSDDANPDSVIGATAPGRRVGE